MGAPVSLAAAAIVIAAAVVVVRSSAHAVAAAVAQQQDQDDDPPHIATTEIIVAHKKYLLIWIDGFAVHSMIFPMVKKVRRLIYKNRPGKSRAARCHRVNSLILKRAISHILPQLPFYLLFSPLPVHFSENKILKSCCSIIACFLGKTESKYSYRFLSNCTLILLSFGFQRLIFPRYFVS